MSDFVSMVFSNAYTAVIMLVLGFGFLVFIHELGHFLVAKLVGIRATQFAIGFGQALVSYRKGIGLRIGSTEQEYRRRAATRLAALNIEPQSATDKQLFDAADALKLGETEYRLNWMPFGGYVKMLGQEDLDPSAQSDDPRAFNRKGFFPRAAVISAGVIMNLLLGVALLMIAFADFAGVQFPSPIVGSTAPNSPAAVTYAQGHAQDPSFKGLQPGDRITHIDSRPVRDMSEVTISSALGSRDHTRTFTIERPGHATPLQFQMTPEPRPELNGLLGIGVAPTSSLKVATQWIGWHEEPQVEPTQPAGQNGVTAGMTLTQLAGQPISDYRDYLQRMQASDGQPLDAVFTSADAHSQVSTTLTASPALQVQDRTQHLLGMVPATRMRPIGTGTPATDAGIQPGDVLAELNEHPWPALTQLGKLIGDAPGPVTLTVLRDGKRVQLTPVTPTRRGTLGVSIRYAYDLPVVADVLDSSPLANRQLLPGSRLVSINDTPISNWRDAQRAFAQAASQAEGDAAPLTVALTFALPLPQSPTERFAVELTPAQRTELATLRDAWEPDDAVMFELAQVRLAGATPMEAASLGISKSVEFIQKTYVTLLRLFQQTVKVSDLRGPVGIVSDGARFSREGWPYYVFFLGLISINLAVINFLPLPIVDGGLMLFLIVEKLRGKPASPMIQAVTTVAGLVMIAGLFLVVTFHDIVREFIQ